MADREREKELLAAVEGAGPEARVLAMTDRGEELGTVAVELRDGSNLETYTGRYGLSGKHILCSSDSHNLWTVGDCGASIELDDEPYSSARVRGALIEMLRGDAP